MQLCTSKVSKRGFIVIVLMLFFLTSVSGPPTRRGTAETKCIKTARTRQQMKEKQTNKNNIIPSLSKLKIFLTMLTKANDPFNKPRVHVHNQVLEFAREPMRKPLANEQIRWTWDLNFRHLSWIVSVSVGTNICIFRPSVTRTWATGKSIRLCFPTPKHSYIFRFGGWFWFWCFERFVGCVLLSSPFLLGSMYCIDSADHDRSAAGGRSPMPKLFACPSSHFLRQKASGNSWPSHVSYVQILGFHLPNKSQSRSKFQCKACVELWEWMISEFLDLCSGATKLMTQSGQCICICIYIYYILNNSYIYKYI